MSASKKTSRTIAIAQARMGSTRFPGKVMMDLGGVPVLQWTISALKEVPEIDEVVLATSTLEADDPIYSYCVRHHINWYRGSESDVLDRFYQAALHYRADIILRLTCDCPFIDPRVVSEVIRLRAMTGAAYASNVSPPTYPDGLDVECFTFDALADAHKNATRPSDRDCVTQYIVRNRSRYPAVNLHCPLPGLEKERWVLDTEDDYKFCQQIVDRLGCIHGPPYIEILDILDKEPELRAINKAKRNERFYEAIANEQLPARTFTRSQGIFDRAIQKIPFAAQTFSKSHLVFPPGRSPLYLSHGDGAYVYDVDGNDYVDLVSALLPVVLGYRDPDVDSAIRRQLDSGISFSLATELEVELAEVLCQLIPCAEMVKFGKSGTDVTTAAIRLARAYTGRDHILVGGYHGWSDWSMGISDKSLGIPDDVKKLSHKLPFGERIAESNRDDWVKDCAAIIVEPYGDSEYLTWLRSYCTNHGIVLIFDEIITGFRWDMGGAQKLFDVIPDLATFGKSMANGMPISALVGARDIMELCQPPDNIFYSGTFFGETLSMAAALATIKKMEEQNVIEHLWNYGAYLEGYIAESVLADGLSHAVKIGGEAPRITIDFNDVRLDQSSLVATKEQLRTLFIQEMIQNGVLIINSNNISFSHRLPERERICKAFKNTFAAIAESLNRGDIAARIGKSITTAPLRASA